MTEPTREKPEAGTGGTASRRAIRFTLNDMPVAVEAPPFAPLSATLRDELHLTGTKIGCEAGDCGACTVLIDGRQVCACLTATAQAEGTTIHTVEGRGPDGLLETLREAFLAHGAAQCGICTPGMLMAAADLLARNPAPTRNAVIDALGGVLCRCTGYTAIIDAVLATTGPLPEEPADAAFGARLPRLDGVAKVEGTDAFGADEAPEDALWLRIIRSPHARARFTLGDLDGFRRTAGLDAVLTAADVPGVNSFGVFDPFRDQPVFAEGHVRFRGEAVLGLVGPRAAVEAVAAETVPITWHPEPAAIGPVAALAPGAPVVQEAKPDNILTRGYLETGDVSQGFREAEVTTEVRVETSFVEHAYIEPEAGYALPLLAADGKVIGLEVTACTQAPYMDREETARVAGLPETAVRIRPTACGGGFGGKLDVSIQPLLAVAALKTKRPVRIIYTRTESMASTTKRHPAHLTVQAGADAQGHLTGFTFDGDFNTGAYASWGPTVANRVPVHATGPYRVPHVRNRTRAVLTNETPAGAFRGFGVPQAAIAQEMALDDLAEKLNLDRLEIRRRNAIRAGDRTPTGQVLAASVGLLACLDAVTPDWQQALARAAETNRNAPRLRHGVGIGVGWYGCGNTSISNPSEMRITLDAEGRLTLWNGAVDIGQGSATVMTQIAAEALGLPVERFTVVTGDTGLTLDAGKTSASRQTFVSGNAAKRAAEALRARLLALANAGPDARLSLKGRTVTVTDAETSRHIDLADLEAAPDGSVLEGLGRYDPPTTRLDAKGQGIPYATYGFAVQIAELTVDTLLGTVKVQRIVAAHDVGRAVNPTLVEGQIAGGIAQGLGLALMEEFIPGRTENLHDYLIPTIGDMPALDIRLIEDPEPEGPFGAKGVGEHALIPTAPAILGAIRHATGVRIAKVPALPHRLWQAMTETHA